MSAFPTREAVATTRVNDVLYSDVLILFSGEQRDIRFEIDLTTSDRYDDPNEALPPSGDTIDLFDSSMGHLLDVFFFTNSASAELRYYEGIDSVGGHNWRLVDQWMISPGIVFKLPGYRVHTSYAKLSLVNGGGTTLVGELQVRLSTL